MPAKPTTLEICAGSLISALIAQTAGADRIELCENLQLGGTTPSFGTISLVRQMMNMPIHVLIRPRGGNFCYSDFELAVMKMDVEACKMLGINGVVIGALNPDNTINSDQCKQLIDLARPMTVTFHRAFDDTPDPYAALKTLTDLGFERVLTSGTSKTALEGKEILAELVRQAGTSIIIMPGGGIRPDNIKLILESTSASEIHSSAIDYSGTLHETDLMTVQLLKQALTE